MSEQKAFEFKGGRMSDYFIPSWELDARSNMESKVMLLVKPIQSQKTFFMIESIRKTFQEEEDGITIPIIFCDNNLLLTSQTLNRIHNTDDLFRNEDGDKILEFSSKSKIKKTELISKILDESVRVICMCSNSTRVSDIDWFFQAQSVKMTGIKFEIWVDEADRFIGLLERYLESWTNFENVQKITMITATPKKILQTLPMVNIIPLQETFDRERYQSFSESKFRLINEDCSHLDYVKNVLDENPPQNGDFWFIPSGVLKKSHYAFQTLLHQYGFKVLVVNGDGKCYFDGDQKQCVFDVFEDEEKEDMMQKDMSSWLSAFYRQQNLKEGKFAITGNFCIGRGITIQSKDLLITHSIFSPDFKNKCVAYQSIRICGMYKKIEGHQSPVVYCSKKFKKAMLGMEHAAKNLAIQAFEKGNTEVTLCDFNDLYKIGSRSDDDALCEEFTNYSDAVKRMKELDPKSRQKKTPETRFEKDENGKFLNIIRSVKKVYSKREILNDKGWGLSDKQKMRLHVSHQTDQPIFMLCYKK
jgi:hypothetical protein